MKIKKEFTAAVFALLLLQLGWVSTTYAGRIFTIDASTISEFTIPLDFGQVNLIHATDRDVVLYLLNSRGVQVASNVDNPISPGGFSRPIRFSPGLDSYRVVAWRENSPGQSTMIDVLVNGRVVRSRIAVGGTHVSINDALSDLRLTGSQTIEIGQISNGATRASLYALDCNRRIIAKDLTSGVGNMPRLTLPVNSCDFLVGSLSPNTGGDLKLYINDTDFDADGDGLGSGLEMELGTCDNAFSQNFCDEVFNHSDSDHDGLSDRDEILGIDHAVSPQLLSRWGANPLHKDMFIEVDYKYKSFISQLDRGAYFRPEAAAIVQEKFVSGSADDLRNPDGQDGVSLHFDLGISANPESTLYGDWGGSNEVPDTVGYLAAAQNPTYFSTLRNTVFRYALMGVGDGAGSGNSQRNTLGWTGTETNPRELAMSHELGHTTGIMHHGARHSRGLNCNPFYRSKMNYLYYPNRYQYFSKGELGEVLSDSLDESVPNAFVDLLTREPFNFQSNSYGGIDWNRDGIISGPGVGTDPVRYPVTLVGDCGSILKNEQQLTDLGPDFESDDTPSLAFDHKSNRMLAVWIESGTIYYRSAASRRGTDNGSCTADQILGSRDCLDWSKARVISTARIAQHVDIFAWNGSVVLAYITDQNQLMVGFYMPDDDDLLVVEEARIISGMPSALAPEITRLPDPDYNAQIAILVSDIRTGNLRIARLEPRSRNWSVAQVSSRNNRPVPSTNSPTVANWAEDRDADVNESIDGACVATTSPDKRLAIHCIDQSSDQWLDVSAAAFADYSFTNWPKSDAKPAFTFYRPRHTDGGPIVPVNWRRGEFWIMTTLDRGLRWQSELHRSRSISLNTTSVGSMRFNPAIKRGVGGSWTSVVPRTGISLVENPRLGSLKGLIFRAIKRSGEGPPVFDKTLQLLPFADGTVPARLRDTNDFRIMDAYICQMLRNGPHATQPGQQYCGNWEQSYWGDYLR